MRSHPAPLSRHVLGPALALVLAFGLPPVTDAAPSGPAAASVRPELQTVRVPAGARFTVRVRDTVSTRTSRVGQAFATTVVSPVEVPEGVALPRGSLLYFSVVRLAASRAAWEPTTLVIGFDSLRARGAVRPVAATWIRGGSTVVKSSPIGVLEGVILLLVAAIAGALIGRWLAREAGSGILTGAALAAVGAAVALTLFQRVHASIPAGSELEVRLDAPVELPAPPPEG